MSTYTSNDGCELYYEVDSPDRGAAVVLLNGMTQSTAHWNRQAKAFAQHFTVLRYDARGQGQSELGEADLSLALHAQDLAGVLDAAGVSNAHLVGFSHGARIALAFANHYPDRLDRLVLCSATAAPTTLARTIVRAWQAILDTGAGLEALAWASLPNILGNEFLENNEKIIDGIVRATVQRNSEEGIRALLESMIDYPDLDELASGVDAPTLVLWAAQDLLVERHGAEKLADLCDGTAREIAGVGHTIPIEAPERFREVVVEFLDT